MSTARRSHHDDTGTSTPVPTTPQKAGSRPGCDDPTGSSNHSHPSDADGEGVRLAMATVSQDTHTSPENAADTLRRAAAKMRGLAEAAPTDKRWLVHHREILYGNGTLVAAKLARNDKAVPAIAHMGAWHPAVALAVAPLLDREAHRLERRCAEARAVFGDDAVDFYPNVDSLLLDLAVTFLAKSQ